ncbi:hypothetical protein Tco_0241157 [Tanacetum coccineum]
MILSAQMTMYMVKSCEVCQSQRKILAKGQNAHINEIKVCEICERIAALTSIRPFRLLKGSKYMCVDVHYCPMVKQKCYPLMMPSYVTFDNANSQKGFMLKYEFTHVFLPRIIHKRVGKVEVSNRGLKRILERTIEIPSGESKVHIEVLLVLWGNRLPIPDGSLPLLRKRIFKKRNKKKAKINKAKHGKERAKSSRSLKSST